MSGAVFDAINVCIRVCLLLEHFALALQPAYDATGD